MEIEKFDFIEYDKDIKKHQFKLNHEFDFKVGEQQYSIKCDIVVMHSDVHAIIAEKMKEIDKYKHIELETMRMLTKTWWDMLSDKDKTEIIKLVNG